MATYDIQVTHTLGEQFFRDVMVTMVESGDSAIWYWGSIEHIVRDEETWDVLSLVVLDDPEVSHNRALINPSIIAVAIERILREKLIGGGLMPYLMRGVLDEDAGDIDATIADVIAQVILFGKVVYG